MNTSTGDELERLRAADPAATAEPDMTALRAAVDSRVGARGAAADELAAARRRRWTTWPVRIAGVAAAALVVGGGGGYAIGAAGEQTPSVAAADVITLQNGGRGGLGAADAFGGAAGAQPGPASLEMSGMARAADLAYWPGYGRTVFTDGGLPTSGGTATAWAFDAVQAYGEETVRRLGQAFGIEGRPTASDWNWSVGATDGSGPNVTINPDGMGSASYYDPSTDPWSCVTVPSDAAGSSGDGTSSPAQEPSSDGEQPEPGVTEQVEPEATTMIAPEPCTQRDLGPAPQGDAAAAQVRDVITALGHDPAAFELVTEPYSEEMWSYVTAWQVVDGQRTGVAWSFSFTGAGLQSFYGALAPIVSLGEYEVISPAAAVERLGDPRFGGGWGGPIAHLEGAGPRAEEMSLAAPTPTLPPTPTAGSAISWPVAAVTIVEARLGSALHTQADGSSLLLPTYELIGADGGIWSVVAVADAHLDFAAGAR